MLSSWTQIAFFLTILITFLSWIGKTMWERKQIRDVFKAEIVSNAVRLFQAMPQKGDTSKDMIANTAHTIALVSQGFSFKLRDSYINKFHILGHGTALS